MISTGEFYNNGVHMESLQLGSECFESKSDLWFMLKLFLYSILSRFCPNSSISQNHNMPLKCSAGHWWLINFRPNNMYVTAKISKLLSTNYWCNEFCIPMRGYILHYFYRMYLIYENFIFFIGYWQLLSTLFWLWVHQVIILLAILSTSRYTFCRNVIIHPMSQ